MSDVLNERAAQRARLAMMMRGGLDRVGVGIPGINGQRAG